MDEVLTVNYSWWVSRRSWVPSVWYRDMGEGFTCHWTWQGEPLRVQDAVVEASKAECAFADWGWVGLCGELDSDEWHYAVDRSPGRGADGPT